MKKGTCIHYTGCINPRKPTCDAGINYREHVGGDGFGWIKRIPCHTLDGEDPSTKVKCNKYQEPTDEQIAASKAETDEAIRKFMVVQTGAVRKWRQEQKWSRNNRVSAVGVVPCEACGVGQIHLSMAAYNGHVHGKCTTENCVSWME
jgi:hypothetical protein